MRVAIFYVILLVLGFLFSSGAASCSQYQNGLSCSIFQQTGEYDNSIDPPPSSEILTHTLPSLEPFNPPNDSTNDNILQINTTKQVGQNQEGEKGDKKPASVFLRLWVLDIKLLLTLAIICYVALPWTRRGLDIFDAVLESHLIVCASFLVIGSLYKALLPR